MSNTKITWKTVKQAEMGHILDLHVDARKSIAQTLEDSGGCDHGVGVCCCSEHYLLDEIDVTLKKYEETPQPEKVYVLMYGMEYCEDQDPLVERRVWVDKAEAIAAGARLAAEYRRSAGEGSLVDGPGACWSIPASHCKYGHETTAWVVEELPVAKGAKG